MSNKTIHDITLINTLDDNMLIELDFFAGGIWTSYSGKLSTLKSYLGISQNIPTTTGTSSSYIVNAPQIINNVGPQQITLKIHTANVNNATIKFNTLSAIPIEIQENQPTKIGDFINGQIVMGIIDNNVFKVLSVTNNLVRSY